MNQTINRYLESIGPIQSLVIPGNQLPRDMSKQLQSRGFDVRAILGPSVPVGKERLRISLQMHNTVDEADELKQAFNELLFA